MERQQFTRETCCTKRYWTLRQPLCGLTRGLHSLRIPEGVQ